MDREDIKNYIKEHLSLRIHETEYGTIKEIDIVLYFDGEEVDRDTLQTPTTY